MSSPLVTQNLDPSIPGYRPYHLVVSANDQQDNLTLADWTDDSERARLMEKINRGLIKCLGPRGECPWD